MKRRTHLLLCGLDYKHVTILNYASSGVNKLRASLNDDARVVIYDCHMFIEQAAGFIRLNKVIFSHIAITISLKCFLKPDVNLIRAGFYNLC